MYEADLFDISLSAIMFIFSGLRTDTLSWLCGNFCDIPNEHKSILLEYENTRRTVNNWITSILDGAFCIWSITRSSRIINCSDMKVYSARTYPCHKLTADWASSPLGPLLLTWINFNPSMDKQFRPSYSVGWNHLSIPKLQRSPLKFGNGQVTHVITGGHWIRQGMLLKEPKTKKSKPNMMRPWYRISPKWYYITQICIEHGRAKTYVAEHKSVLELTNFVWPLCWFL